MKNLLVTLLSDQTVPNVQFIKEKQNDDTYFLFVSTSRMEEKGVKKWIMQVCGIKEEKEKENGKVFTKVVDQFSLSNIEAELNAFDFTKYERITVNVTGGTKLMSLGVTDFFKQKNANIYYVHNGLKYSQIFPERNDCEFTVKLTVSEYLKSCGITYSEPKVEIVKEYTITFLDKFLSFTENEKNILIELNNVRNNREPYKKNSSKKGTCETNEIPNLAEFLGEIKFPLKNENELNKDEVKYLTGDWYEQWCYIKIKEKFNIADDYIKTGIQIKNANGIGNELDVVYMYDNNFCIIECKTDILSLKGDNILTETIYKQGALKSNFGLTVQPRIYTLSSKESKAVKDSHIIRAEDFRIMIKCKEDLDEFLQTSNL
jgi:hypothetical protein